MSLFSFSQVWNQTSGDYRYIYRLCVCPLCWSIPQTSNTCHSSSGQRRNGHKQHERSRQSKHVVTTHSMPPCSHSLYLPDTEERAAGKDQLLSKLMLICRYFKCSSVVFETCISFCIKNNDARQYAEARHWSG